MKFINQLSNLIAQKINCNNGNGIKETSDQEWVELKQDLRELKVRGEILLEQEINNKEKESEEKVC